MDRRKEIDFWAFVVRLAFLWMSFGAGGLAGAGLVYFNML